MDAGLVLINSGGLAAFSGQAKTCYAALTNRESHEAVGF